jgi:hypothetical protein
MTAQQALEKYPALRELVDSTVKDAKYKGLTAQQGVKLLAQRLEHMGLTGKRAVEIATELWVA